MCANGLIVSNDLLCYRIRHQGDVVLKMKEAATHLITMLPKAESAIEAWKGITLSADAKMAYAEAAKSLRWADNEAMPMNPAQLLQPKRWFDKGQDLWTTFNVVQENLIRGGNRYIHQAARRRASTRAVTSVSENTRLNTALWTLTEKMAELSAKAV